MSHPFVQKYLYDSLDRITEAKETVNGTQAWIQNFGYDRYGNRISHSQTVLGQPKPINETTLPSIDAYTNRFSNTTNYEFDAVGNLIRDAEGRQFTFNGDNKQIEVQDHQDETIGEYLYDGLGKRIKKITDDEYVVFVYDGLGKLIAEYSTDGPPTQPMVHYTATDPLGSPRVLTNENGTIVSRRDFMPFGEEIEADSTYRTATLKYGIGDNVRQKFTGYQRDDETDLDFAEARYYYNNHGRFTAVDPLLASGKSDDPQTFNRYAYALSRPLIMVDPTGLQTGASIRDSSDCSKVKVDVLRVNQPKTRENAIIDDRLKDANGKPKRYTGVGGSIYTVLVGNQGVPGVKVDEEINQTNTKNGQTESVVPITRSDVTNEDGRYEDKIGTYKETDGTKATNDKIKNDFSTNTRESVETQKLTLTFPAGGVCTATSTRTFTNASPNGPSLKFTLTTTKPVVAVDKPPEKEEK